MIRFVFSARHVEACTTCQQRLNQLAAEPQQWDEVSALLHRDETGPWVIRGGPMSESSMLSPPRHPELAGRLGRYDIERLIGQGGMGVVWKGFDTELNRPVAIKLLAPHLAHHGAARSRFAREARAAAAVVHEHVVAIHNVETDGDVPFLVMQYVAGESLQARVDREGPLEMKEVLRIGVQAAAGLASAHEQGVIHRDVKPANILLEHGVDRAMLTDFGLARTVDDASLTTTGCVTGTPHYMSPEQATGESSDYRTDLFSLGAVLYFMAAGRPPFRAEKTLGVLHRICREAHTPLWRLDLQIPGWVLRPCRSVVGEKASSAPVECTAPGMPTQADAGRTPAPASAPISVVAKDQTSRHTMGHCRHGGDRTDRWHRAVVASTRHGTCTAGSNRGSILGALADGPPHGGQRIRSTVARLAASGRRMARRPGAIDLRPLVQSTTGSGT